MDIVCDAVNWLVCVPEGGVWWDIQVVTTEEVGIIRNVMSDRRRVVQLGT